MRPLGMDGIAQALGPARSTRRCRVGTARPTPVVRDGERIVWLAGVRMSEEYRVGADTARAVRLTWERELTREHVSGDDDGRDDRSAWSFTQTSRTSSAARTSIQTRVRELGAQISARLRRRAGPARRACCAVRRSSSPTSRARSPRRSSSTSWRSRATAPRRSPRASCASSRTSTRPSRVVTCSCARTSSTPA